MIFQASGVSAGEDWEEVATIEDYSSKDQLYLYTTEVHLKHITIKLIHI